MSASKQVVWSYSVLLILDCYFILSTSTATQMCGMLHHKAPALPSLKAEETSQLFPLRDVNPITTQGHIKMEEENNSRVSDAARPSQRWIHLQQAKWKWKQQAGCNLQCTCRHWLTWEWNTWAACAGVTSTRPLTQWPHLTQFAPQLTSHVREIMLSSLPSNP